jgi:hypothetical protein
MTELRRVSRQALTGLAALLLLIGAAQAQRRNLYGPNPEAAPQQMPIPVNPNQYVAPNMTARQLDYNTRAIGQAGRNLDRGVYHVPYAGGYGGYPGYYGAGGPYGYGGYNLWPTSSYPATLQGYADLTQAQGQYWNDIQQARLTREESRRSALDTQKKQVEYEMWYESVRPTSTKIKAEETQNELNWARKYASGQDIWSGRSLNVLLKHVLSSSSPTRGPDVPFSEKALQGINLTDGTTRANLSLTKDDGKIEWTDSLEEAPFDEARNRFSKNFAAATQMVQSGRQPPRPLRKDLDGDLKKMEDQLDDQAPNLPPSRYIESRRLLNQLKDTLKGFSNAQVVKCCHNDWKKEVRTVADLVAYCGKNGLEFGPAVAPGDEASYTATYYALRAYERGLYELSASPR